MHITECAKCHNMFRDSADTAGICPHCGHWDELDQDEYGDGYLRGVVG